MCKQEFACSKDAQIAAERISRKLPLHQLTDIEINEVRRHTGRGRPRKDRNANVYYQVRASVVPKQTAIDIETGRAGRFILATNVVDASQLSDDDLLREYKAQQSTERGFRFLKDPLFFTSSVFLNLAERVAAIAMVMGLCLLVYSLGQRALRQALLRAKQTIDNQLGNSMPKPYSYDLRQKVIQAIKLHGLKISEASLVFSISRNTINLWLKRLNATGDFQALPNQPPGNGHSYHRLGKIPRVCLISWR